MSRYIATIVHHSIKRARVIDAGNSLTVAKAKATREFGDEFEDCSIQVYDRYGCAPDTHPAYLPCVAARRVHERKWTNL
jgi:hypothetical protein